MPLSRRVARFNRLFANHFAGPLFTRLPGFGTVHHRGRRSGTQYRTPVKLFRGGDEYYITLPYGARADWVRNVLAAGGCEITTRGRRTAFDRPRVVTADEAGGVPALTRRILARLEAGEALALSPAAGPPDDPTPAQGSH